MINWLRLASDLSWILSDPNDTMGMVGDEDGEKSDNGIAVYKDSFGSYRYVYYISGEAVAGLQVVTRDGKNGQIANVYTKPDQRRKGHATQLLNRASEDFDRIVHSNDLNDMSEKWISGL